MFKQVHHPDDPETFDKLLAELKKEGAEVIERTATSRRLYMSNKTKSLFFILSLFPYLFKESTKLALTISFLGLMEKINVNTALVIIFCCFYCSIDCRTGCNTSAIEEA